MHEVTDAYLALAGPGGPFDRLVERVDVPVEIKARNVRGLLSRPLFVAEDKAERACADLRVLFDLLVDLPRRLFDGDLTAFGRALGLTDAQIELAVRTRLPEPRMVGRGDLYLRGGEFSLLELNLGSALGGMEWTAVNRALLAAPEFAEFARDHRLGHHDPLAAVAAELRRSVTSRPDGARPVVVLTDWPGSYEDYIESFELLADLLDGPELDVRTCAMGQLRASSDGVWIDGTRVDLLHRFFGLGEIARTPGGYDMVEPFVRAHESGATPMFLPFDHALYSNKAALAMLSDERCRAAFEPAELAVVDRLVPWTRPLVPGEVDTPWGRTDLLEHCRARQDGLILKPASGNSAEGILSGWACDRRTWLDALSPTSTTEYVVQERVSPDPEPMWHPDSGRVRDFAVNWGLFVIGDGYAGGMTRGVPASGDDPVIGGPAAYIGAPFHVSDSTGHRSEVGRST